MWRKELKNGFRQLESIYEIKKKEYIVENEDFKDYCRRNGIYFGMD